ncbi:hypothetical protein AGMMS49940_13450 [Spirochaetia bacterium]|nr:hypothetical protein AGMMS49940_13450 [Spirochaetia bacterium]
MGEAIKAINVFLQDYSGIITSLLVILVFIGGLSKRFKNWIFRDIHTRLDKIEKNDLKHNDLFHDYSGKMLVLILDVMSGGVSKEDISNRRAVMAEEYNRELEKLLKSQGDSR